MIVHALSIKQGHPLNREGQLSKTIGSALLVDPTSLIKGVNMHPLSYDGTA